MKRTAAELRAQARTVLKGNYGLLIGANLIISMATFMTNFIPTFIFYFNRQTVFSLVMQNLISFVISLILSVMGAGNSYMILNVCRGKKCTITDLFHCYKNNPDKFILIALLRSLILGIVTVPSLVFLYIVDYVEPVFVLGFFIYFLFAAAIALFLDYSFAFVTYLMLDNMEKSVIEAFKESWTHMKGNRGSLLWLHLSFMGYVLLSVCTCYIALLWIMPYLSVSEALFYRDRIGELDQPEKEPDPYDNFYHHPPTE